MDFFIEENYIRLKENEKEIGNVWFGKQSEGVFRILRVFVDESYRGQGIAGKLVLKMVEHARENNFKLIPVCSFAVNEFARKKEYADVLFEVIRK